MKNTEGLGEFELTDTIALPPPPPPYNSVVPLMSRLHGRLVFTGKDDESFAFAANLSAIALTTEEIPPALMHYPVVFSSGEASMPVVLTGIPGGANQYVDGEGRWRAGIYVPAYVRRYPFLLAKLTPETQDLSLCFDETCSWFGEADEGNLFIGDEPTDMARGALQFCEQFEQAATKTRQFMTDLHDLDLLIEAQAEIKAEGEATFVLRGFQMVSEERLRNLRGDQYRRLGTTGSLGLVYAHLFSLRHMSSLFDQAVGEAGRAKGTTEALDDEGHRSDTET